MNDIEEIKTRLNIVDVIGEYVKLQKSGANWRARCPFHSEKTPSFFVSSDKQIWHCFGGCNKGGDMFRFLIEIENIEFGEALRLLAQKAGVSLQKFNKKTQDQKSVVFEINELAAGFFQKAFERAKEGGPKAREYLIKRGVSEESIERFKIGYAPSSWRSLLEFLEERGYKREDIIASGLVVKNEEGKVYDRFRARIMFPVQQPSGSIAGFSGRTLLEDVNEAKYINTPQTIVYDKSRELYGIYQAKQAIKQANEALFVEGNIDVILSSQAGVENVVATSGTALAQRHLDLISRYTNHVTFCFDADSAGEAASKRAFETALEQNFEVKALLLNEYKDPAEIVAKKGSDVWREYAEKKLPLMEYIWAQVLKTRDISTIEGKKAILQELYYFLSRIARRVEQGYWLKEFSSRLDSREEDVLQDFQKSELIDKGYSKMYDGKAKEGEGKRAERLSQDRENLAALILLYPEFSKEISETIDTASLSEESTISREELLLKAELFWPTEYLARRELKRILTHLAFKRKKEETITKLKVKS